MPYPARVLNLEQTSPQRIATSRRAAALGLAVGFLVGLFWSQQANAQLAPDLREPFQLADYAPIELQRTHENHLYVVGRLDGRRRSVLVDTGWSLTTLSTNAARKLRSPAQTTNSKSTAVTIGELRLGRSVFTNEPARVEHMIFNRQPASFDVVLGCDFLRRHFAVIDCGSRRLYVRNAALSERDQQTLEASLRASGFQEVPLQFKRPLAFTCLARINDHPVELLVDSGAAWSCLDERQCARLGLKPAPSAARITGAGKTGTRPIAVAEVKSFQLGGMELSKQTLALLDLADWGFGAAGQTLSEVQGILGGEMLAQTGALIDCHRLTLWVKPPVGRR